MDYLPGYSGLARKGLLAPLEPFCSWVEHYNTAESVRIRVVLTVVV